MHDLSSEGKVIKKLVKFDQELDSALSSLKQLAQRYDDRLEMIKSGRPDKDQVDFLIKLMRDFQKAQIIIKQSSTMRNKVTKGEAQSERLTKNSEDSLKQEVLAPAQDRLHVDLNKSYTRYLRNNKNSLSERNVRTN